MTVIEGLLADDHPVLRDGLQALLDEQADIYVVGDASAGQRYLSRKISDTVIDDYLTVDTYRSRLLHKLGVGNTAGLIRLAFECGLTPP